MPAEYFFHGGLRSDYKGRGSVCQDGKGQRFGGQRQVDIQNHALDPARLRWTFKRKTGWLSQGGKERPSAIRGNPARLVNSMGGDDLSA
jgi:hypothetical protein